MNQMIVIDAKDLILGRLATFVAAKALLTEEIRIVNCEKAVISGNKDEIIAKYQQKRARGEPAHGPHFPRRSDLIVKRTIRGMLPYKLSRGEAAFKRVKCFLSVPDELKDEKFETIENANADKLPTLKYIYLEKLSKILGANQ